MSNNAIQRQSISRSFNKAMQTTFCKGCRVFMNDARNVVLEESALDVAVQLIKTRVLGWLVVADGNK